MKTCIFFILTSFLFIANNTFSQNREDGAGEIQTLFSNNPVRTSGGYGAISNKFTEINGQTANIVEMYGGWYINQRLMLGLSGSATTNNLPVPVQYRAIPGEDLSYEYGQFGLATEYVWGSNKAFHVVFHLMTGAGFTVQYNRNYYRESRSHTIGALDENWFYVAEPGVQLEMNLFRWMRFSPGYSYRAIYGSDAPGLSDNNLSGSSFNLTLKFGKF